MVNKRLIESLNKAGAFASTGWNRRQVDAVIEAALGEGQSAQRDRASGQTSLFDMGGMEETVQEMNQQPDLPEWPEPELLQYEKDMLGLYISSHPLENHAQTLRSFNTVRLAELRDLKEGAEVSLGGLVNTVRTIITSKGGKMAFVGLETLEGTCEITVFADLYEQTAHLLTPDSIVMVTARVNYRNDEPSLLANSILEIDQAEQHLTRAVHIRLRTAQLAAETVDRLAETLGQAKGPCDVFLHCQKNGREYVVHAIDACTVAPSSDLKQRVERLLGPNSLWYSSGNGLPSHNPPQIKEPEQPRWKQRKRAMGEG